MEDEAVSIAVPKGLEIDRVLKTLESKRQWIKSKINPQRDAMPTNSKAFVSGEPFPYLGRHYQLKIKQGQFEPVKLMSARLVVKPKMIRNALIRWYKYHALHKLQDKVHRYAQLIDLQPTSIDVKSFKALWGSCSAKSRIAFNWKIILAPNRMVD